MTENIVAEKFCPSCRFTKPAAAFHKGSKRPDGLQAYCKDCCSKAAKARAEAAVRLIASDMPGEEWRPVLGFERIYEVSNLARIRRVGRAGGASLGHVLRPYVNNNGYEMIELWKRNRRTRCLVHRIVAGAFLGPCPDGGVVNHLDSDTRNNRPENLEHTNQDGNMKHASRFGRTRKGSNHQCAKLTEADVREMRQKYGAGGVTYQAEADRCGVNFRTAYNAIKGITWQHI